MVVRITKKTQSSYTDGTFVSDTGGIFHSDTSATTKKQLQLQRSEIVAAVAVLCNNGSVEPAFQICSTQTVLKRIPFKDLNDWVNDPLPDDANFLDNDLEQPRLRLSDDQAWQQIVRITGVYNSCEFQKLDRAAQRQAFIQLKELGASVRQLQRLTGIDRGIIQRAR